MRVYSAASEEALRARKLLKDWAGEGFLTDEQYQHMEKETVSELRTTNVFLRLVLFFFTLVGVGAAVGLFLVGARPSEQSAGFFFLIFAAACYGAAEFAASQTRLYRYGIEEALAACSVGFLCVGIELAFFTGQYLRPDAIQSLVPAAGAIVSLWIWQRFGLSYAFLASMIFIIFVPACWTSSAPALHVLVALFYVTGLICVTAVRSRHRFDCLDDAYSIAEGLLWLGIYLAINLRLTSVEFPVWWNSGMQFPRPFYWTTWVLIWCLPPIILARGIRQKDRLVMAVGVIAAVLTFISNKPYLGWPRHTWDPMLLGILLTGVALFLRRWLANGPDGMRHGFTAIRLSGKDKLWIDAGSAVFGLTAPQAVTPTPQPTNAEFHFGGGQTGGGGAGGNF